MSTNKTAAEYMTYEAALILARANRRLNDFLRAELSVFDLTSPEWEYLGILQDTPNIRVQTFALLLDVEPPFATRLGNQLSKKGLIRVTPDAKDARVRLVTLTQSGKTLIDSVETALRKKMREYLSPISRAELDTFLAVTSQIAKLPSSESMPKIS